MSDGLGATPAFCAAVTRCDDAAAVLEFHAVEFLVFSQHAADGVPLIELGRHATRFFDATVEPFADAATSFADASFGVPGRRLAAGANAGALNEIRLVLSSNGERAVFAITKRAATAEDVTLARDAEVRMHTAGLADLAARCASMFVVVPVAPVIEWMTWECCALVASVSLGPVLSSDGATLVGVKSARARAEALRLAATR